MTAADERLVDNIAAMQNPSIRKYLLTGDMNTMTEEEQASVLAQTCAHMGIDPVLGGVIAVDLQGKKKLYVTKVATDIVARANKLTRKIVLNELCEKTFTYFVKVEISDSHGRVEEGESCVSVRGFNRDQTPKLLTGEDYGNAIMKAHTKARRRATLAWVGVQDLDFEMEDRPEVAAVSQPVTLAAPVPTEAAPKRVRSKPAAELPAPVAAELQSGEKPLSAESVSEPVSETPQTPQVVPTPAPIVTPIATQKVAHNGVKSLAELPTDGAYVNTNLDHKAIMVHAFEAVGLAIPDCYMVAGELAREAEASKISVEHGTFFAWVAAHPKVQAAVAVNKF